MSLAIRNIMTGYCTDGRWIILTWERNGRRYWREGRWAGPDMGWRDRAMQRMVPDGWIDLGQAIGAVNPIPLDDGDMEFGDGSGRGAA